MKAAFAVALFLTCQPGYCQNQLRFDVATIKPASPNCGPQSRGPVRITYCSDSLLMFLTSAHNLDERRVQGPAWLDAGHFDLTALIPEGSSNTEISEMLQVLLRERFNLQERWETRDFPVYALSVGKSGIKAKPSAPDAPNSVSINVRPGLGGYKGSMTMERLAEFLSRGLDRHVVDATGLQGRFDIDFAYAKAPTTADPNAEISSEGSVFTVLPEVVGLELKTAKAPLKVLVIDRADRTPIEN